MNERRSTGERTCICADPENCTQRVPGYRCKKDFLPRPAPIADKATLAHLRLDPWIARLLR